MCSADARIYNSERLAACYAADRPLVHAAICARLFSMLGAAYSRGRSLDVGCGAGASTLALLQHSAHLTGVDPSPLMLRHARTLVPAATFVRGSAEALPLGSRAYDLVTAAGSLNYADVRGAMSEIARVLTVGGHFAPYDFSTGCVHPKKSQAVNCFGAFERAFPWPPGYSLDLAALPYREYGMTLLVHEQFPVEIVMSETQYIRYVMSETNVEAAIAGGIGESEARETCRRIFEPLFTGRLMPVTFGAEFALARTDNL